MPKTIAHFAAARGARNSGAIYCHLAYFGYIDGLSVRDLKMRWEDVTGPWKHGLVVDHCTDLMLDRVDVKMPEGAEKDVLIEG